MNMIIEQEEEINSKIGYSDEEHSDLEIDLDNNTLTEEEEQHEPLDLSVKTKYNMENNDRGKNNDKLDKLDTKKGNILTDKEITKLLEPHVKILNKKFFCTVCDTKFVSKSKAVAHIENKHVDCLLYKCPLCKVTKVTRLAYENHMRRGHVATVKDHSPVVMVNKSFYIKSEPQHSQTDTQVQEQSYDWEFVTFMRTILSFHQLRNISCAEWIDQEQSIFRINNKEKFAKEWYMFKDVPQLSWDWLYNSVIKQFINRNILKHLPGEDLVFQVFCIKGLLK